MQGLQPSLQCAITLQTMKVLIIEDEQKNAAWLAHLISDSFPDFTILPIATNMQEALSALIHKPDIFFVDIQLENENAIGFFESHAIKAPYIIFTTAYQEYALAGFNVGAIDYLLKPISKEQLVRALSRVLRQEFKRIGNEKKAAQEVLRVQTEDGFVIVNQHTILYINRLGTKTIVKTTHQQIETTSSLAELEKRLSADVFIRVHTSYLVNGQHVMEYKKGKGGTLVMSNGENLLVSYRKKNDVMIFFDRLNSADQP